jgi:hypothetical protein
MAADIDGASMTPLSLFGLFAVTAMLVCHAAEPRTRGSRSASRSRAAWPTARRKLGRMAGSLKEINQEASPSRRAAHLGDCHDLTSLRTASKIEAVRFNRRSVVVIFALVACLATSASVSCATEPVMADRAQMACCRMGHDHCPMHGSAADCCKAEGQRHEQMRVATHEVARVPVQSPAPIAVVPEAIVLPGFLHSTRLAPERRVLIEPSPPPYLLGSAFLV